MATVYSNFSILLPTTSSNTEATLLNFLALPPSSSFGLNESASLGSIKGVILTSSRDNGVQGRLNFFLSNNSLTGSTQLLSMYYSGSNDEPRVGVGFEEAEEVLKPFEVKSKIESTEGTEILLRSSRVTEGAQEGDEGPSINFVIDSSSFSDITTTGSLGRIRTVVDAVNSTTGVGGRFIFTLQRNIDQSVDMLELGYGTGTYPQFYSTLTSKSIEIVDNNPSIEPTQNSSFIHSNGTVPYTIIRTDNPNTGNAGGLIQVNNKFGTGSIFLHGPNGNITASLLESRIIYTEIISASVLSASSAFIPSMNFTSVTASAGIVADSLDITSTAFITDLTGSSVNADDIGATSFFSLDTSIIAPISLSISTDSAEEIDLFSTSSHNGVIYDYVIHNGVVGSRTGNFMVVQNSSAIEFTDTSTISLGTDSTPPSFSASFVDPGSVRVSILNGNGYTFKALAKRL